MTLPPLAGARIKVERAKRHVHDLQAEIDAFHGRGPYEVIADDDPQTGDQLFRVRIHEHVPAHFSGIIGDIIHNLRAAFDLMAADVVAANGGDRKTAYFPVSYTPEAFKAGGLKKVKGASQQAIDIIERLQPYHAGNEAILRLHKLDILDKHQAIIPVGAVTVGIEFNVVMDVPWQDKAVAAPPFIIHSKDRQFPLKDGTIIFAIRAQARDPNDKNEYKFGFDVAFGEGQIVDGEPLFPTLSQLGEFTEKALDTFDRELFR